MADSDGSMRKSSRLYHARKMKRCDTAVCAVLTMSRNGPAPCAVEMDMRKRRGWRLEKAAFSEEIAFSLFHAPISSSIRKFKPRERPRFDFRLHRLPAAAEIRRERFGADHARWPWLLTRVGQR